MISDVFKIKLKNNLWFVLYMLLICILDIVTTKIALDMGFTEKTPFMKWVLISYGEGYMMVASMLYVLIISIFVTYFVNEIFLKVLILLWYLLIVSGNFWCIVLFNNGRIIPF